MLSSFKLKNSAEIGKKPEEKLEMEQNHVEQLYQHHDLLRPPASAVEAVC